MQQRRFQLKFILGITGMTLSNKYKLLAYGRALARSGMLVSGLIMMVLQSMAIAFTPPLQVVLFSILGLGIASNALEVAAYLYGHTRSNGYARDVNLKWFSAVFRLFFEPALPILVLTLSLSQPANTVLLAGLIAILTQKVVKIGAFSYQALTEEALTGKARLKTFALTTIGSFVCIFIFTLGVLRIIELSGHTDIWVISLYGLAALLTCVTEFKNAGITVNSMNSSTGEPVPVAQQPNPEQNQILSGCALVNASCLGMKHCVPNLTRKLEQLGYFTANSR